MKQKPPIPLAVVVLCHNEERNLPRCLASVAGWVDKIFVVDSGSVDRSREIAREYDATVVEHPFETHAKQWNWAFANIPIETEWVMALDADHQPTPELRREISDALRDVSPSTDGYYVKRRQIFRGKWIKHGGYYPKYLLKLFRLGKVRSDENEFLDFRFYVPGKLLTLKHDLIEDNVNDSDIDFWTKKHLRFASLQAQEEYLRRTANVCWTVKPSIVGTPDQRVIWAKRLWYQMPLYLRPIIYFFYRYFFLLGFLDGREGFVFHFLQAFWYRLLVDIKLEELARADSSGE